MQRKKRRQGIDIEEVSVDLDNEDDETKFRRLEGFVAKLKEKPATPVDWSLADPLLPPRIFARGYYPIGGRVNGYSKLEMLGDIAVALKGSQAFVDLMNSQFGRLFKIPPRRASFSGKIVHNMLSRQLWTTKPHELWFVFAGQPIRFSLREFHLLTGLNCGVLPDAETIEQKKSIAKKSYLEELTGKKTDVKVSELLKMLKSNKNWPEWKKLRVALILIVDGIVAVRSNYGMINPDTAEMCRDLGFFLSYPWGRESFSLTINDIVPDKSDESLKYTVGRQKQQSLSIHGFPLAIQLLAYKSISGLDPIPIDPCDEVDYTQRSTQDLLMRKNTVSDNDIIVCELDSKVQVETIVQTLDGDSSTFSWGEEDVEDPKIQYLWFVLKVRSEFSTHDWPGGDYTCPRVLTPTEKNKLKDYEAELMRRKDKEVDEGEGVEEKKKRKRRSEEEESDGNGEEEKKKRIAVAKRRGKRKKTEFVAGGGNMTDWLEGIKEAVRLQIEASVQKEVLECLKKEIREVVKVEVKAAVRKLIKNKGIQRTGGSNRRPKRNMIYNVESDEEVEVN